MSNSVLCKKCQDSVLEADTTEDGLCLKCENEQLRRQLATSRDGDDCDLVEQNN